MDVKHNHNIDITAGGKQSEVEQDNEQENIQVASRNKSWVGKGNDDMKEIERRLRESEERCRVLEEQVRESETRFRLLFEQVNVGMALASLDGQLIQVNQQYCDIVGYTREELLKLSLFVITYSDDAEKNREILQRLLFDETQVTSTLEKRYIRQDGSTVWANVSLSLLRDSQGKPLHYVVVVEDISKRKRAEEERDRSFQQEQIAQTERHRLEHIANESAQVAAKNASELDAIMKAMADGLLVYGREGQLLFTNPAARQILGLDGQEAYSLRSYKDRIMPYVIRDEDGHPVSEDALPLPRILKGEVLKGKNILDTVVTTLDGREIQVSVSGAPVYDGNGEIIGGAVLVRDVTERRRLERRTHAALGGLLNMAEALVQLPESTDGDSGMNAVGRRLTELTRDILDCQQVGILAVEPKTKILRPIGVVGLSPEREKAWWREQMRLGNTLSSSLTPELVARLQSKEVVALDMMQPPFRDMPNPFDIKAVLIAPICISDRLIGLLTLDYGMAEHIYTEREVAFASAIAKLSALVIERQRLLSERAEAQGREVALREANRRMEEFLGIASHELRTPLTTIKANIQLAKRRLSVVSAEVSSASDKIDATLEMLSRAERQVGVLNRLVGDMIDISRIQTGKLQLHLRQEPSDLVEIVSETVQEQRKALPNRTIELFMPPSQEPVLVIVDPHRIAQVLTNYISNAFKYSSSDTPVEVTLQVEKDANGKDIARVSVRDHGPGLPPEEQKHVWDCFYQAQGVNVLSGSGVGLGLGLYISQTIITRHHGHVGVQSTPGVGSTFWFTLPLAQEAHIANEEGAVS